MAKAKLDLREITLFGILGALTFGAKFVMSGLPNIEPVSLMVMIFGTVFGLKGLFPIYIYVILEILVFGISLWNVNYLYIWAILWLSAYLLRRFRSPLFWAVVSGLYGLSFGVLCAPVDVFIGSFSYAAAKIVSGFSFDLLHCAGNFVIALVMFAPLRSLVEKLYLRLIPGHNDRPVKK